MKRVHRRVHGILWPLLAPAAVVLIVYLAQQRPESIFRPPTPASQQQTIPEAPP